MYPKIFRSSKVKKAIASKVKTKISRDERIKEIGIVKKENLLYLGLKPNALICHLNVY
jgi:hypothetical protein